MSFNGDSVTLLVDELLRPLNASLEYIVVAGAIYRGINLASLVWECLRGLRTYFVPFGRYSKCDLTKEFGKWAVITGATSGVGLAYAKEFARRGVSVVLVSRNYDDLVQIVSDIQSLYGVQAYGIHADFSLGARVFQEIEEALTGYEIGILVNNVAIHYDHPQYFALVPPQRVWQLINVNIAATTVMTHMLLPQMLERRRGAIINVCSNAACTPPIPLSTGYTATMAYVDNFSQALHYENYHRGIVVQTLLPCFIARDDMSPSLFTPNPATYVRHAIATLGTSTYTCGYWPHAIQSWVCSLVPRSLWIWGTGYLSRILRKRCLIQAREVGNGQLFVRRRHSNIAGTGLRVSAARRISDVSFRRSPSPRRRSNPTGSFPLPSPIKKQPVDSVRRFSGEDTPSRASSGDFMAGGVQTIPELPGTPDSMRNGSPPSSSMFSWAPPSATDVGVIVQPRRTSSASAAETGLLLPRRHTMPRKHSRVLVVPSVAMVSLSPAKNNQEEKHDHVPSVRERSAIATRVDLPPEQ